MAEQRPLSTPASSLMQFLRRNLADVVFVVVCGGCLTAEFLVAAWWD